MAAKSKVKALLEAMGGEWKSCDCCGKLFDVRTPKSGTYWALFDMAICRRCAIPPMGAK